MSLLSFIVVFKIKILIKILQLLVITNKRAIIREGLTRVCTRVIVSHTHLFEEITQVRGIEQILLIVF